MAVWEGWTTIGAMQLVIRAAKRTMGEVRNQWAVAKCHGLLTFLLANGLVGKSSMPLKLKRIVVKYLLYGLILQQWC